MEEECLTIKALLHEIERLQNVISDYRDDFAKVLDEKCPSDERHCGCVPILRKQLDLYKNALMRITTYPSSNYQTYPERRMQQTAMDALNKFVSEDKLPTNA